MSKPVDSFEPGQKVVVTQQIARRDGVWTITLHGEVVRYKRQKTGAWFAHSKDDKLWLDRLVLKKDDGEIVVINLDPYTHVEAAETPASAVPQAPGAPATPAQAAEAQ